MNHLNRSIALSLTLASTFVISTAAQTATTPAAAAPAGPLKVAVIAFQAVVGQTNEFQRDFADLQKKYEPKRTQLKTMADEVEGLEKQAQAAGDKATDAQRKAIDDKKKSAQRLAEDAQNDLSGEMNDVYSKVASKVFDVLSDYAKKQGYTLVMDETAAQQQSPIVLYHSENVDISKAVIDAYNTKSGVPAPPPQAADAPRPASKAPAAH